MNRIHMIVGSAMCALVLAGCTSEATEPPGPTASPTASESATPTPTPTPTQFQEQSDPELGIVFEDAPVLEGDAADVYNWIATYNKEYWRTMTTNTLSPAFSILASPEVQATMQQVADTNTNIQGSVGGVLHSRIGDIVVNGGTATGTVCDNYRDVTFTDPNGSYTPTDVGFGTPRHKTLTLTRIAAEARWMVLTSVVEGTC